MFGGKQTYSIGLYVCNDRFIKGVIRKNCNPAETTTEIVGCFNSV